MVFCMVFLQFSCGFESIFWAVFGQFFGVRFDIFPHFVSFFAHNGTNHNLSSAKSAFRLHFIFFYDNIPAMVSAIPINKKNRGVS